MKMFTIITLVTMIAAMPLTGNGNNETEPAPMMEGGAMMESESKMDGASMMEDKGLIGFTDMEDAMKKAESKPTVLFFEASWCPSCQSARKDFEANSEKFQDINLISVDYDHSADLQTKYGVTYQHTFVQIDSEGMALAKWNGGSTEELLMNVEKGGM